MILLTNYIPTHAQVESIRHAIYIQDKAKLRAMDIGDLERVNEINLELRLLDETHFKYTGRPYHNPINRKGSI